MIFRSLAVLAALVLALALAGASPAAAGPVLLAQADGEQPGVEVPPGGDDGQKKQRERRKQAEEELRRRQEQRQQQREERNRNRNAGQGEDEGGGQGASQRERRRQAEEELRQRQEQRLQQRQRQREDRRKQQAQEQGQGGQRAVEGQDEGVGQGASQRERRRQAEEELRRRQEQRQKQREDRRKQQALDGEQGQGGQRAVEGQDEGGGGQGASQRERRRQAEEELRRKMEERRKKAGQAETPSRPAVVIPPIETEEPAQAGEQPQPGQQPEQPKAVEQPQPGQQSEQPKAVEQPQPGQQPEQPKAVEQPQPGQQSEQPKAVEQPQPGQQSEQPQAGDGGQADRADRADVMRFLRDRREPESLSDSDLRDRAREAESLLADPSLKPGVRERLERERAQAERELSRRGGGQGQPVLPEAEQAQPQQPAQPGAEQAQPGQPQQPAQPGGEPSGQPQTAEPQVTPPSAAVEEARRMTDQDLRQRVRETRRRLDRGEVSGEARARLERQLAADRGELQRRIEANAGGRIPDEAIERPEKAREEAAAIIRDTRPARDLSVDDLRQRVNRNRALLAVEGLTDAERRDLRRRLAEDRDALRDRAAVERREERDRDRPDRPRPPGRFDDWDDSDWDRVGDRPGWEEALTDRRPSRALSERELNRRIRATRTALERGYDGVPRAVLVERLRDDRRELRRRMRDWRDERDDWWDRRDDDVNISIGIMIVPGLEPYPRPPIDYAEVDDEMLQEWLVAPPTMPIDRRYTVREIEEYPAIRQAMPGIEIDSIRFGFNQDFVPEEEIGELSRIGEMLEAILRSNPNEVFLIEGHTDAVGSPGYNLDLSRRRAESVKAALTDFFNIDPGALETAGYGEQFLKIPTPDEEPENRRVTIRRITPLVGQR